MSIATRTADIFGSYTADTETTWQEADPYMTRNTTPIIEPQAPTSTPAQELRFTTAAVRVAFTWFGTRRAVSNEQRDTMAGSFEADGEYISAGKKLVNTKHPAFRAVTKIRTRILEDWRDSSLPFPEPGIRLIRQADIDGFTERMERGRTELTEAVAVLESHFGEIREEARRRLGSLYDPTDYPTSLDGLFAVTWEFPSVEPPDYLMQLRPELYEIERSRVAQQFDEAVRLAEEAFTAQFADAISHLCERLTRAEDGQAKVFRDTAVGNLTDFFERFKTLGLRSNAQLDALVEQAQQAVKGASPAKLRQSTDFRETVARQLADVERQVTALMVDRPRRKIDRTTSNKRES